MPPAAAGAVALEEAGHDRGTVGDTFFGVTCSSIGGRGERSHAAARQGASWALGFPYRGPPECVLG